MNEKEFSEARRVHCIGIGGIGVSAVARMFRDRGVEVSGSDISRSRVTEELEKNGIKVFYGQSAEHISPDIDLVVHTVAVQDDNPELLRARELGLETRSYPEALGIISRSYKTIAVSGTHGKTTTTAMTIRALEASGADPTAIIGSLLKETLSNYRRGSSDYLVIEADEYRRAFANYAPYVLVITNIDFDHPDYFKDLADVQEAFKDIAKRVPAEGAIVTDLSSPHVLPVVREASARLIDYRDYIAELPKLGVSGEHNRENAAAALGVADVLGFDRDKAADGIAGFEGAWRRFEYKGKAASGARVYDDYAHNPQKVAALISGAREAYPDKKLVLVFQPHTFSRTKALLVEFASALAIADKVLLLPIYGAREKEGDFGFNSEVLLEEINGRDGNAELAASFDEAVEQVLTETDSETVVIAAGAGDVYKIGEMLTT